MRNITFTSLLRLVATGVLGLIALPTMAAPPEGCFARSYSDAHLARYPAQVVRQIVMSFGPHDQQDENIVQIAVRLADQGHVGRAGLGGRLVKGRALCGYDAGARAEVSCALACEGSALEFERNEGKTLVLKTYRFPLGGQGTSCRGGGDLAEVEGEAVIYKVTRQPASICRGLR